MCGENAFLPVLKIIKQNNKNKAKAKEALLSYYASVSDMRCRPLRSCQAEPLSNWSTKTQASMAG